MDFDVILVLVFLLGLSIMLVILTVVFINEISKDCIEYEDLCYKKQLAGKTYIDKPTSCSDDDVRGHKNFCVKYSKGVFEK